MTIEQTVRAAYLTIAGTPRTYIPLHQLRASLPAIDRATLDQHLIGLMRDGKAALEPEQLNHRITADDRTAAIDLGGEPRHRVSLA